MMEKDNSHAITFIVVAAIILGINVFGIVYGYIVDSQVEETREVLRVAYDKEYSDGLSKIIADLEMSRKVLGKALIGFLLKVAVGALLTVVLFIPNKLYEKFEVDIFKYITPDSKYQVVISAIIIAMSLWNVVSPLLEIGDYISLYKEMGRTLASLNAEALIESLSTF